MADDYNVSAPAIITAANMDRDPINRSFNNFQTKLWKDLFDARPTPLMYDLGLRLQHGPKKDIVMGFRGLSKSYITVGYSVWGLRRNAKELVLSVAASGPAAGGNADLAWGWINHLDWLTHMKPRGVLRYSANAFDVMGSDMAKSESFASISLFGPITGRRASIITPDDVETPNTSSTETERQTLRTRYRELGGAILIPGGQIKVLGTPQTEDTLYTELAGLGYGMRIYPAVYPAYDPTNLKKDEVHRYSVWLDPKIAKAVMDNPELAGTPVEPSRFDIAELMARKIEYGVTEYDRQFRLFIDVGQGVTRPLKLKDCPVVDIAPPTPGHPLRVPSVVQWAPIPANKVQGLEVDALNGDSDMFWPMDTKGYREYWQEPESGVIIIVDPSGGGTDETAAYALTQHVGLVTILDAVNALEGFSATTMMGIAALAKKWNAHTVRIEKNFGGGMFAELLRPFLTSAGVACTIEEEFATGMKEKRIVDALEGLSTGHRLCFNLALLQADYHIKYPQVADAKRRNYRLTYQFTRITKTPGALAHDDRVDAVGAGVAKFLGTLSRVLEQAAKESRDMAIEAEIKRQDAALERASRGEKDSLTRHRVGNLEGDLAGSPLFRNRGR